MPWIDTSKRKRKPVKVWVVHSHERGEGSSIVLVTTNKRKALRVARREHEFTCDVTAVEEMEIEP